MSAAKERADRDTKRRERGPQAMPATNPVANAFYVSADATGNGTGPLAGC